MNPRTTRLAVGLLVVVAIVGVASLGRARPRRTERTCNAASIFIEKSERYLELRCAGLPPRRFPATFGANPVGPKRQEGDERTPEGRYRITSRVSPPRFHRFLGVSYPNAENRAASRALGIRRPGRGIGIHGVREALAPLARIFLRTARSVAWGPTDGCIGLTNEDVEVVYEAVRNGTEVEIVP